MTLEERIALLVSDERAVTDALCEAVRRAVEEHRRWGRPLAVGQGGKVVWVDPDTLSIVEGEEKISTTSVPLE
jgi:hypothetical protein